MEKGGCTTINIVRMVLVAFALALFVVQWAVGDFPLWFFAAPMNLLLGLLWLLAIWEGYRHRERLAVVRYLLSAEATYVALAVAVVVAVALGLQSEPASTSWPVVGGLLFVQSVLTLVLLRGWRNERGVRWRFLATHIGLWLAVTSALFGAPDKEILRLQVGVEPTREAVNERGQKRFLDYELRLERFDIERSESGSPEQFVASVAVDDKVVDIEVNSPYSQRFGEDIYLVNYASEGCVLQIVREPWRGVTAVGVVVMLLGAVVLFLQGFGGERQ
jgi:hypothetical protein